MEVEYAIKIMKQNDTTICPFCLKNNSKQNCENIVICNKNLNNFTNHSYEKENSILLKCNESKQIKKALELKQNIFKINNDTFKNKNGELWKQLNKINWKKIF